MAAFSAATAVAAFGWLLACAACAQARIDAMTARDDAFDDDPSLQSEVTSAEELLFGARTEDATTAYQMPLRNGSLLFGFAGSSGGAALGPPISAMRRHAGLDDPDEALRRRWLNSENATTVFTVGYMWRDLTIERSAFSTVPQEQTPNNNTLRIDSRSTRLSYKPTQDWIFQFSRGSLSGLDQVDMSEGVKRTSLSATYRQVFHEGEWQTTFAWGRNSRKSRESIMGYLLESSLRVSGANVFFGRLEQVGSDDLMRENESMKTNLFKMNKFTVGYFHNLESTGTTKVDVGVFASRHFIPTAMVPAYGSDPIAFMMFIRLKP